jgi:phosphate transport system permease protein
MLSTGAILALLILLTVIAYAAGRQRIERLYKDHQHKGGFGHDAPIYHGLYVACYGVGPAILFYLFASVIGQWVTINTPIPGALLLVTLLIAAWCVRRTYKRVRAHFPARKRVERLVHWALYGAAGIAVLVTFGIIASVLMEAIRFFNLVPIADFLFGMHWSPQVAMRADQAGATGAFGMIPLLVGTLLITVIALIIAVPVGLMSAIYLSEYASPKMRDWFKPVLELLAGIPTVVYGYFALLAIAPLVRGFGDAVGLHVSSESALATGIVMGVMIIPFISSLSDDMITAVPRGLRDASYGLGATKSETIRKVVLRSALPGIMGAFLLAISRAIGETMIVVMAAGLSANLTVNPFEAVTTMTVQMVTLLVGDQEFNSPKTLAAFALGLTLFVVTLVLNIAAMRIVKKYREQYE